MNKNFHPLQTRLWAEFRKQTGVKVVFIDDLIITIHKIPYTNYTIGYLPKGPDITLNILNKLKELGQKENCIFIQIEPNIEKSNKKYNFKNLYPSSHSLFTKYNFILDLTKSEETLLKNMQSKTRYNIHLAQKKGVIVKEDNSEKAFKEYFRLTDETTKRQGFFAHTPKYHQIMRDTFKNYSFNVNDFTPHLLLASYQDKVLVAWLLFTLNDTLYYPYGASSSEHREVMASNLMMWEAIKFGKKLGLKKFDMWGAANVKDPKPDNKYYGFHKFKSGYGPKHIEYVGSYDFVLKNNLYMFYKLADKLRWILLKIK